MSIPKFKVGDEIIGTDVVSGMVLRGEFMHEDDGDMYPLIRMKIESNKEIVCKTETVHKVTKLDIVLK
jgi:hypothetical protein